MTSAMLAFEALSLNDDSPLGWSTIIGDDGERTDWLEIGNDKSADSGAEMACTICGPDGTPDGNEIGCDTGIG